MSHATQRGFRTVACFSLAFGLASFLTPAKSDAASLVANNPIVGTMDMDNIFSADSQFYQVAIPEEKTYAIIFGLAALGAGLYRRHQKGIITDLAERS